MEKRKSQNFPRSIRIEKGKKTSPLCCLSLSVSFSRSPLSLSLSFISLFLSQSLFSPPRCSLSFFFFFFLFFFSVCVFLELAFASPQQETTKRAWKKEKLANFLKRRKQITPCSFPPSSPSCRRRRGRGHGLPPLGLDAEVVDGPELGLEQRFELMEVMISVLKKKMIFGGVVPLFFLSLILSLLIRIAHQQVRKSGKASEQILVNKNASSWQESSKVPPVRY